MSVTRIKVSSPAGDKLRSSDEFELIANAHIAGALTSTDLIFGTDLGPCSPIRVEPALC